MYEYRGKILRVVDGDTVHINLDLGLDVHIEITGRLARINAPEMSTDAGKEAKSVLTSLIDRYCPAWYVQVNTVKDKREKYGRYLVELFGAVPGAPDGTLVNLNDLMVQSDNAVYKVY